MSSLIKRGKTFYIYYYDQTGIKRGLSLKTSDKKEAQQRAKDFEARQRLNLIRSPFEKLTNTMTPDQLLAQYTAVRTIEPVTLNKYKYILAHLKTACGVKYISNYTVQDDHALDVHLRKEEKAANTHSTYKKDLITLWKFAKARGWVQAVIWTAPPRVVNDPAPIPEADFKKIITHLSEKPKRHQHFLIYVQLLYLTAMRSGELLAAHREDFDEDTESIFVRNQKCKRFDYIPYPKQIREYVASIKLPESGPLFPKWHNRSAVRSFWRRAMLELKMNYTLHQIRKTRGSDLANSGMKPALLMRFLRHRDIQTTMRYYVRIDTQEVLSDIEQREKSTPEIVTKIVTSKQKPAKTA